MDSKMQEAFEKFKMTRPGTTMIDQGVWMSGFEAGAAEKEKRLRELVDDLCMAPPSRLSGRAKKLALEVRAALAPPSDERDVCGKSAELLSAGLSSVFRACVRPKNHFGICRGGGTCFVHGDYVGNQCCKCLECISDERGRETP